MKTTLLTTIGRLIYRLRGWTFEPLPDDWQSRQVIIAFPHAEWLDTAMAFGGFAMVRQKGHVLVKKEAFTKTNTWLLNRIGAIAVDRKAKGGVVGQMIEEFAKRDVFQLSIVPQGTRRNDASVKTGFWYIAKGAGVPVVCWYFDHNSKRTRWVGRLIPGDDIAADLQEIGAMYAAAGFDIPGLPSS
ncbi:MAG: 1-acyl-sn-glycerol-3-phosphate acyltransferase [Myxococcales bacterium]|nr:1-acyl-sn-glycerol-3-phosphate acyltransferase [Myxococcales bacterium]